MGLKRSRGRGEMGETEKTHELENEVREVELEMGFMFISSLNDNLNAEVALGIVTNVKEACTSEEDVFDS
ncbi:hypothetical protein L3X38_011581 [Prunus dulcis]|uniref:Uncharacterized protein n=1 Tax=Prunus dulcis TaxID=3755 RepID=A0AAD4ZF72_PRUDU|nr:hypothetical protein L3X38_011581 [Prunus dulcis]